MVSTVRPGERKRTVTRSVIPSFVTAGVVPRYRHDPPGVRVEGSHDGVVFYFTKHP